MDQEGLLCDEEMGPWSGENEAAEVLDESPGGVEGVPDGDAPTELTDFPPRNDAELQSVVAKERSFMPGLHAYSATLAADVGIVEARARVVAWMIKVRSVHSFTPMTVALAVSYLDRYLSKHLAEPLKTWVIQLLSVACISLAAKMEEIFVPCLSDLQVDGMGYLFEAKTIQRMELVVLKSLDWRMRGVTAFEYVDDLLSRLDTSRQMRASMLARITELILGTLPEAEFLAFQPSVIAVTAFSCALDEILPIEAETYQKVLLAALPINPTTLGRCYRLIEDRIIDPVCCGLSLYQPFGNSKSPPSPVTVIELHQTGDCDVTHVNVRKRKIDDAVNESNKRGSSGTGRIPGGETVNSVWDMF